MNQYTTEIAIVGIAGKYPKANSPKQLWENLVSNLDLTQTNNKQIENYVNKYFAISDIDLFDNEFFGYTAFDASIIDPQHRILLKCVHEALEDAGYEKEPENGKTGVFVSSSISTYLLNVLINSQYYKKGEINYPILIGNDKDFLATKISYKLNLTGPSVNIQTACSSSLVAAHYACQSLLNGECDIAVVGGVSISVPQEEGYIYKEGGILSPDGICRPFDANANGTIKGNGCSVLVLRRLTDSIADGDRIYAVISGTAVNNDGANKIGFTAPSLDGESSVIREALSFANLDINDIDYIETHGTGTKLGDPIEIKALNSVFNDVNKKIPLGSIKANIGHLDVAAGLTSVIKSIFVLKEGIIPPIKHFNEPNSVFNDFEHHFYFPKKIESKSISHISVNSFGMGGTNANAIISKFEMDKQNERLSLPCYLIPLYVNHTQHLDQYKQNIQNLLTDEVDFRDFVYSMSVGKKKREQRLSLVANNKEDFLIQLKSTHIKDDEDLINLNFTLDEFNELSNLLPSFGQLFAEDELLENSLNIYQTKFVEYLHKLNILNAEQYIKTFHNEENIQISAMHRLFKFLSRMNQDNPINFGFLYSGLNWQRTSLPAYPLSEKRFWIDSSTQDAISTPNNLNSNLEIDLKKISEKIVEMWKFAIGEQNITSTTNYFDLGADSLAAIDIIDQISNFYKIKLTTADFLNNPTPIKLATVINNEIIQSENFHFVSLIRKTHSTAKNIFLIHPAGGTNFCYSMMNRFLNGEYNLYGIDLPDHYATYTSMEALGAYYLTQIKKHQSNGPYIIGGYSFGGNLAYEMAIQLEKEKEKVGHVIMFDSHPPAAYNRYRGEIINYNEVLPNILCSYFNNKKMDSNHKQLFRDKNIIEIIDILKSKRILETPLSNDDIVKFYNKWIFNHKLLKEHHPERLISADLILFEADQPEDESILSDLKITLLPKDHWKNHISGKFMKIMTSGNHYSMFGNNDNVKKLAILFDELFSSQVS